MDTGADQRPRLEVRDLSVDDFLIVRAIVRGLLASGAEEIVLDLQAPGGFDPEVLALFFLLQREVGREGSSLRLVGAAGEVADERPSAAPAPEVPGATDSDFLVLGPTTPA